MHHLLFTIADSFICSSDKLEYKNLGCDDDVCIGSHNFYKPILTPITSSGNYYSGSITYQAEDISGSNEILIVSEDMNYFITTEDSITYTAFINSDLSRFTGTFTGYMVGIADFATGSVLITCGCYYDIEDDFGNYIVDDFGNEVIVSFPP